LSISENDRLIISDSNRLSISDSDRFIISDSERMSISDSDRFIISDSDRLSISYSDRLIINESDRLIISDGFSDRLSLHLYFREVERGKERGLDPPSSWSWRIYGVVDSLRLDPAN
jgi:hypothetical protein